MINFSFEVIGSRFSKRCAFDSLSDAAVDDPVLILLVVDMPLEKSLVSLNACPLSRRLRDDVLNNDSGEALFRADMELAEAIIGCAILIGIVEQRSNFGNSPSAERTCEELPNVDCMGVFAASTTASTPEPEVRIRRAR